MIELVLKVALAPVLVVLATLVARRWGDRVGGIVIAVPVVAGPILLVLALEQGGAFVHEAAQAALLGIVAVAAFCVVCGRCLQRGWPVAIAAGWLGYAVATVALAQFEPQLWPALAAALLAIVVARVLVRAPSADIVPRVDSPSWDLAARAGATVVLVVALTSAASALGPTVSGLLTPFPVATSVVMAFTIAQGGADAAARTLRGYLTGLPGFTAFFVLVALVT
jgi:hypothetical protein